MLNLDGNVSLMANPLNEERKNILKTTRFNKKEKYNIKEDITNNDKVKPEATEELVGLLDDLKMDEKIPSETFEDCFTVDKTGSLHCKFCEGVYKREGHMRNHLESKHNKSLPLVCHCGKKFPDSTRFTRHNKSC